MPPNDEFLQAVAQTVRRFAEEQIAPHVDALERGERTPDTLFPQMREALGLEAIAEGAVSSLERREERGGGKGGLGDPALLVTVMHELSRVNPGFALSLGASIGLCGQAILRKGTPEQRRRWARPVLALERVGAWGLTEPEAGSDAFSLRTTAKRVDGGWELSGQKTFITNAPVADVMVVYARTDEGLAAFVVERSMPGLAVSKPFEKMGMRSSPTGAIYLDQVRVTDEHLLGGRVESGKRAVMETLLGERVALCAMALGIIERSLEIALSYAKERTQFGQPIAQFQAVQLTLARIYAAQETVRALVERGLRLSREGKAELAFFCAAKYTASSLATQAALDAVQVLGGNGYMQEFRVEGLARDAKLLEIGGGTSDIQLLSVARELLK